MNRAIKASIAVVALLPAGIAVAMPAGADNEIQINLGGNNCQVFVNAGNNLAPGDNGNVGSCYYVAAPDLDSFIYAETLAGVDTTKSELFCNGTFVTSVTDVAGGGFTRHTVGAAGFTNPGGVCELRVTIGGGLASTSKGQGWVSWVPTP